MKYGEEIIGKRIRLISMDNDPNPIESGSVGTIYHIGGGVINVRWTMVEHLVLLRVKICMKSLTLLILIYHPTTFLFFREISEGRW